MPEGSKAAAGTPTGASIKNNINMGKKKVKVRYNAPGWEDRTGTIYSISGDKVTIEFGKHFFIEVYRDGIIFV